MSCTRTWSEVEFIGAPFPSFRAFLRPPIIILSIGRIQSSDDETGDRTRRKLPYRLGKSDMGEDMTTNGIDARAIPFQPLVLPSPSAFGMKFGRKDEEGSGHWRNTHSFLPSVSSLRCCHGKHTLACDTPGPYWDPAWDGPRLAFRFAHESICVELR